MKLFSTAVFGWQDFDYLRLDTVLQIVHKYNTVCTNCACCMIFSYIYHFNGQDPKLVAS